MLQRLNIEASPAVRSRCVIHRDILYLSGIVAENPNGDIEAQTREVLQTMDALLKTAGADKTKLLTVQVWIADMALFEKMNAVWNAWVDPRYPPSRACVKAELFPAGRLVEMVATATR